MAKKGGVGILLLIIAIFVILVISGSVFFTNFKVQTKERDEIPKLNVSIELQRADKFFRNWKYNESALAYKKILDVEPDNYLANMGLAESYTMLKQFDEAMTLYNNALSSGRYDYRLFFGLGNYYAVRGDYGKSHYYMNKSYNMNSHDEETFQYLMAVTNRIGDYNLTIELSKISIKKFGETANAYRKIAIAYFFKNDFQRALVFAKKADRIVANYSDNKLLLGIIYLALNETDTSLEEFQKVTEIRDSNSALEGISIIYKIRSDRQNYEKYKALANSSGSGKGDFPLSTLGYALLNINQYELAADIFNLAISVNPSYYLSSKGMGEALLKQGKKDQADYYLNISDNLLNTSNILT